jgi:hypothetical protein
MSTTKSRIPGAPGAALAVLIAAGLAACGGSAQSPTGANAPLTDSSAPTVILSQTLDEVPAGGQRVITFSVPRRGALALTVRWSDANNSVTATLSGQGCTNFHNAAGDCPVRRSTGRQGKEGREEFIDDPEASGTYFLLLENLGPGTESIRVTAEVTPFVAPVPPTPYPTERPDRRSPNPRRSWEP